MNKLKIVLTGHLAAIFFISQAFAGNLGIGVTGSYITVEAAGSETSTGNAARSGSYDNNVFIGSIYAEYSLEDASWGAAGNGITIGAQYTPGKADVSDKTITTTVTPGVASQGDTGTKSANAEIENYRNYYIELPIFKSVYFKAGKSTIDVKTKDTQSINKFNKNGAATPASGSFGDAELDGTNLGIGIKGVTASNVVWKIAYERTNFDTLNLTSTTDQTVTADLDTSEVNLSIGYRF